MTTVTDKDEPQYFNMLATGELFTIAYEDGTTSPIYEKRDETTALNMEDRTVLDLDDEVFSNVIGSIRVNTIEDSVNDLIDLTYNFSFPDYEICVSRGDRLIGSITVHGFYLRPFQDKPSDSDDVSVYVEGKNVWTGKKKNVLDKILELTDGTDA